MPCRKTIGILFRDRFSWVFIFERPEGIQVTLNVVSRWVDNADLSGHHTTEDRTQRFKTSRPLPSVSDKAFVACELVDCNSYSAIGQINNDHNLTAIRLTFASERNTKQDKSIKFL
ncbi:hypothetical protein Tsp_09145 [Trichinella spiralis]|uniref:hypothetical protein n=1 Tax=Trichinella spiralis TaxID=6334 RepID=UPI0001EFCD69|nr:hypothetical protein Tsp_09145 [Trichinella spiralis]